MLQVTIAEVLSKQWTYSDPGVCFDSGAAIRKQCTFLHGDNSRVWMAHCRRDCRLFWQDSKPGETVVPGQFDGYLFLFLGLGMAKARNVALASLPRKQRDDKIREAESFTQRAMDSAVARHFVGLQAGFIQEECKLDVARRFIDCPGGRPMGEKIYRAISQQVQLQGHKWMQEATILFSYEMVECRPRDTTESG